MNYFLAKTEPGSYSIQDLARDGETLWDGVHNFQAINFIKTMVVGDKVYIYHSQTDKAIVGLAEVICEPFENKADARASWVVRLRYIKTYANPLTLTDIKAAVDCSQMLLVRNPRLSVMPVPAQALAWIQNQLA